MLRNTLLKLNNLNPSFYKANKIPSHFYQNATQYSYLRQNNIKLEYLSTQTSILNINRTFAHKAQIKQKEKEPGNETKTKTEAPNLKNVSSSKEPEIQTLTTKDKFKRAIAEYGSTIIVFHVAISLVSLGSFYVLVSSGLNVVAIFEKFGVEGTLANAGTFATAYALHKVLAPLRITMTLGCAPLIVRYLRSKGILKVKK